MGVKKVLVTIIWFFIVIWKNETVKMLPFVFMVVIRMFDLLWYDLWIKFKIIIQIVKNIWDEFTKNKWKRVCFRVFNKNCRHFHIYLHAPTDYLKYEPLRWWLMSKNLNFTFFWCLLNFQKFKVKMDPIFFNSIKLKNLRDNNKFVHLS